MTRIMRIRLFSAIGALCLIAGTVVAYDFQENNIIAFRQSSSAKPGNRSYYIYDSNLVNKGNITFSFHADTNNYTPRGAIRTDGLEKRFWVDPDADTFTNGPNTGYWSYGPYMEITVTPPLRGTTIIVE